jgi:energy-converting hydrogenase Eha subunit C
MNIVPIIFCALGIIFLILSVRRTNPVQSKAWLQIGIIFLVVAAFVYFQKYFIK